MMVRSAVDNGNIMKITMVVEVDLILTIAVRNIDWLIRCSWWIFLGNRGGNYRGGNRGNGNPGYNGNGYQRSSQYQYNNEQQNHPVASN